MARGPARKKGSAVKQLCSYKKRRAKKDVKNKCHTARREEVDLEQCRPLRSHCQTVKFCGQTHLDACLSKKKKAPPVGREALDTQQLASLFQTLLELGRGHKQKKGPAGCVGLVFVYKLQVRKDLQRARVHVCQIAV